MGVERSRKGVHDWVQKTDLQPEGGASPNHVRRHRDRMGFVAVVDGEIVGWVHLGASAMQRVRRTIDLTVGVGLKHRKRGIGSRLLQRGTEWGAANRFRTFRQRIVRTNDGALAFLDGHGWEKETIRWDQYIRDGKRIDEVVMVTGSVTHD